MFEIKNGNIYHTRGDTMDFDVKITVDKLPQTDYTALFSIKKNYKDADYLFQRSIEDGHIHIAHADTQSLPFGDYFYDIQVRLEDGTVEGRYVTFGPYQYHLLPDVTTV